MAMVSLTYDLPTRASDLKAYKSKAKAWIDLNMAQPGAREFRGHRSATGTTPQVVIQTEFDSLSTAAGWAGSAAFRGLIGEMRKVGCSNLTARVWDASPILPQPLRKK